MPKDAASQAPQSLTHLDAAGRARMVDVGAKPVTARSATAEGYVVMRPQTLELILRGAVAKGEVLAVARVAGIMAAKRTGELIPLCHPLPVEAVEVSLEPVAGEPEARVRIEATARITGKTGIEMEALSAVTVAALTVYDMCKGIDRGMRIEGVQLLSKTGGRTGTWRAE